MLEARFPTGTHEVYQLPLGLGATYTGDAVISAAGARTVYDATADPACIRELVRLMAAGESRGDVRFVPAEGGPPIGTVESSRPMGVEQSNSSLVIDDRLVLKVFRRVEAGTNPELEMLRFLTAHGFPHIAALAGWYEYEGRLVDATLGVLQAFLADGRDGWELTLEDMDGEEQWDRLRDLGRVTGEMHTSLASDGLDSHFAPEIRARSRCRSCTPTSTSRSSACGASCRTTTPPRGRRRARRGRARAPAVALPGRFGRQGHPHPRGLPPGQTMLTGEGWRILDFEGEPARPLPERRRKRSPLRDVAGMLRSFAYAASAQRLLNGREAPADWEERAREVFLEGYMNAVDPALLPAGGALERLLSVFELEKAVYELRYELNNRPDWVAIPAAALRRLLEAA
jgi:predicted trehalose synthase